MVFEAKFERASYFKKVVDAIRDLIQECTFECTATGMTMQSMDSSHVCLVSILIKNDEMETYKCDRPQALGVNLTNLSKVLKCAGTNDTLRLSCDDEGNELYLSFENEEEERAADFTLRLMTIDEEHLGIPDAKYDVMVSLPTGEFQRICRDLKEFGDSITVSAEDSKVLFKTRGDIGEGRISLKPRQSSDSDEKVAIDILGDATTLTFALKYMVNFTKAGGLTNNVTINMAGNTPLCVSYNMDTGSYIRFYLAPKIEDN